MNSSVLIIGLLLTILAVIQAVPVNKIKKNLSSENTRPIIGILSQPVSAEWNKPNRTTYIAASYVKYVEGAGGQVVPILMNKSIDYYLHLFNSLNGVLFPGGDSSDEYFYVAKLFYTWAMKEYDEMQKSFPIWGTCLGFETLLMLTRRSVDILDRCKGYDYATELTFTPDANESRLLGPTLPANIRSALQNEPTTSNYHNWCMRPENFTSDPALSTFYRMLSISPDLENRTFVSTIESRRYPIFGTQWHPEKNGYEWRVNTTIPHSKSAIDVMQYVANFLVEQARQNTNHFDSLEDETKYLIYQYTPEYMGLDSSHFQQIYFFSE